MELKKILSSEVTLAVAEPKCGSVVTALSVSSWPECKQRALEPSWVCNSTLVNSAEVSFPLCAHQGGGCGAQPNSRAHAFSSPSVRFLPSISSEGCLSDRGGRLSVTLGTWGEMQEGLWPSMSETHLSTSMPTACPQILCNVLLEGNECSSFPHPAA